MIGYARVSTTDQTLDLQLDALQQTGCEKVFTDTISGAKAERPGLGEALEYVRPGEQHSFVVRNSALCYFDKEGKRALRH